MSKYPKRLDGRKFDQLRDVEAKVGVVKNAVGSAMFRMGKTTAIAAVYGPKEIFPKFLADPKKGFVRCHYNMMPFSGSGGDRIRPGGNRRSKEISEVTAQALQKVVNLKRYPNTVVEVFIEVLQADAGTRCVGICAASMALADAGVDMNDLIPAISVGKVDDSILVDLNYDEEAFDAEVADIPVAMIPSTGEITLLQLDGKITKEQLMEALNMAKPAIEQLYDVMKNALKEKYKVEE